MGAVGASGAGIFLHDQAPVLIIPAMMAAGGLTGAAWGAIPGLLRAYFNTNEIITSLMLNYVAGLVISYLIFDSHSYWRDLSTFTARVFPQGKYLGPAASWPALGAGSLVIPFGFLVGVVSGQQGVGGKTGAPAEPARLRDGTRRRESAIGFRFAARRSFRARTARRDSHAGLKRLARQLFRNAAIPLCQHQRRRFAARGAYVPASRSIDSDLRGAARPLVRPCSLTSPR